MHFVCLYCTCLLEINFSSSTNSLPIRTKPYEQSGILTVRTRTNSLVLVLSIGVFIAGIMAHVQQSGRYTGRPMHGELIFAKISTQWTFFLCFSRMHGYDGCPCDYVPTPLLQLVAHLFVTYFTYLSSGQAWPQWEWRASSIWKRCVTLQKES